MIKNLVSLLFVIATLHSCNTKSNQTPTDVEGVATAFIRNILDNKFDEAEKYLLDNETNRQYFDRFRQSYKTQDKNKLEKYKEADILINEISAVSDSVSIVNYSNTYIRESKKNIKLVRINGKWLVDFQYTFSGNL
jgi:hypothetical protein